MRPPEAFADDGVADRRSISEVADRELLWVPPSKGKNNHQLRAGNEIVATLSFGRGAQAQAVAADHQWIFRREGFWRQRVTVRVPGLDNNIAVLRLGWLANGGQLEFPDGRAFRLAAGKFWKSDATWSEDDRQLIRFKSRGVWKPRNSVEIDPGSRHLRDLALLVLLGYYYIRLRAEEMASAGAGA